MPKLRVSGRIAALAGLVVATATALVLAMAGPAVAAGSQLTSCTDQVRVRSQPSATAPVIGSCKAGEKVTVDETRNGFAHLVNKQGWASVDYVAVKGRSGSNHPAASRGNDNGNDNARGNDNGDDNGDNGDNGGDNGDSGDGSSDGGSDGGSNDSASGGSSGPLGL
ncbi:MAG TPA: SH3 domain-containing protein [Pseudonocardia sp.]|nr:SH3 domain-containing protein [Pseudonocardia sp.]